MRTVSVVSIGYRDKGSLNFGKYVNSRVKDIDHFHDATFTYHKINTVIFISLSFILATTLILITSLKYIIKLLLNDSQFYPLYPYSNVLNPRSPYLR